MLIPIDKKPDWQNPPVITLLLIIINVFCFTLLATDKVQKLEAFDYYLRSQLPNIEIPLYIEHLKQQGEDIWAQRLEQAYRNNPEMSKSYALQRIIVDGAFLDKLERGQLINADHPDFSRWQAQHRVFQRKLDMIASYRFSLRAYALHLDTLVTHLFVHADLAHLLWNMLFLFIFGFIIEAAIGHWRFLGLYMAAGITSALAFILIEPHSALWNMGASGAIAGLAGSYAILYGRRKIRFFYTLLVYFDYIRAPAYILLPVWLGYEIYSHFAAEDDINNLAHIGGLLFGALAAWLLKHYSRFELQEREETLSHAHAQREQAFAQAMQLIENLQLSKAKPILDELLTQQATADIVFARFNIAKYEHDQDGMLRYARELFSLDSIDDQDTRITTQVFDDIREMLPAPMLPLSIIKQLALWFVQWRQSERLATLTNLLFEHFRTTKEFSETIMAISNAMAAKGQAEQAQVLHQRLLALDGAQ